MKKFTVRCPGCGTKLLCEERHFGRSVPCPACRTAVQLDSPTAPAEQPKPSIIEDPFADIADTLIAKHPKPQPKATKDVSSSLPQNRKKQPSTNRDEEIALKSLVGSHETQDPTPSDEWTFPSEPYIDELKLGELSEVRSEEWLVPSALPPVQKRLIKKPQRSAEQSTDTEEKPDKTSNPGRKARGLDQSESPSHRRWLTYAVFFFTLLPLACMILLPKDDDLASRLNESAEEEGNWNEGDPERAPDAREEWEIESPVDEQADSGVDEFIRALPEQRIRGAFLSRDSSVHWILAAISGGAFVLLFIGLFRKHKDAVSGAILGAIFTATIGIVLLLGLQSAAFASSGPGVLRLGRRAGIIALFYMIVRLIGFSYRCALEPGAGFVSSFMGFTLGVGICEEVCKILPVLVYLGTAKKATWQGSCLVGLTSGVGFGVSEGIMYSSNYYNGISGAEIYLVRFISCVALHAAWTGAGSVLLYFNQESLHAEWTDVITIMAMTLGISIILHGLYDTLLKQEMPVWALLIGILSVGWLIGVVEKQSIDEMLTDFRH